MRALVVAGAAVAHALACAACPATLPPPFAFPAGVYDVTGALGAHDCDDDPDAFVPQQLGVFEVGLDGRAVPLVSVSFDGRRGETWQDLDPSTSTAQAASATVCGDDTESAHPIVGALAREDAAGFDLENTTTFGAGATCLPIPADGCSVVETFTFALAVECTEGTEPDRDGVDAPWSCAAAQP